MPKADAFKELGLSENASDAEIKSAYRKLARKHHPDVDPNGTKKMALINAAYERLTRDANDPDPVDNKPPPQDDPWDDFDSWESEETSSQSTNGKI